LTITFDLDIKKNILNYFLIKFIFFNPKHASKKRGEGRGFVCYPSFIWNDGKEDGEGV
jgi:hypothetical protein